jgi:hypothetical protein
MPDVAATLPTDAGMWLLWQPEAFATVCDYDTWSLELEDDVDIVRHIRQGHCVPINIGQDMAAAFIVRVAEPPGGAELTEREGMYLVVSSDPYLFESQGTAVLSGIEGVMGGFPQAEVTVPPGRWAVTSHLIAWDDEPGAKVGDDPGPNALPDFILLVEPTSDCSSSVPTSVPFPAHRCGRADLT